MKLFLAGDVMTGRGIDQILPRPCRRRLHEPYIDDARSYVRLAEARHGRIEQPAGFSYVWGEALGVWDEQRPDFRVVNLETAITESEDYYRDKDVHYRMSPENIECLRRARLELCTLANNHVLDWGATGLLDTLEALARAGLACAGAGRTLAEARRSVVLRGPVGAVAVGAFGFESSGIPADWAATATRPGVWLIDDLTAAAAAALGHELRASAGDAVVVASIHWGDNWGYEVPPAHVRFAHALVDAGVDVVFGHSSHHPRPIEVYRDRLILYGCGDFLDDYEGISGYESYRGEVVLMYFATLAPSGALLELRMVPMQLRGLRLRRGGADEARWLAATLGRVSAEFGTTIELAPGAELVLDRRIP